MKCKIDANSCSTFSHHLSLPDVVCVRGVKLLWVRRERQTVTEQDIICVNIYSNLGDRSDTIIIVPYQWLARGRKGFSTTMSSFQCFYAWVFSGWGNELLQRKISLRLSFVTKKLSSNHALLWTQFKRRVKRYDLRYGSRINKNDAPLKQKESRLVMRIRLGGALFISPKKRYRLMSLFHHHACLCYVWLG